MADLMLELEDIQTESGEWFNGPVASGPLTQASKRRRARHPRRHVAAAGALSASSIAVTLRTPRGRCAGSG